MTKIHRAEVVGSMLRPEPLLKARAQHRAGKLDADALRAIEDGAVDEALRIQEAAGVDVVTDGEMRRDVFFDFFVKGLTGVAMLPGERIRFHGSDPDHETEFQIPFSVTERVTALSCPALEEFEYASKRTSKPIKVTLPSPMMILGFWSEHSRDAYSDPFDLAVDAAEAVRRWMRELADAGCTYIQIDAPELCEAYADESVRHDYARRGIDAQRFLELGTELTGSLADARPDDVTIGMHLCKGNGTQSWIAEGGYAAFSEKVFPRASGYDVFHFEFDDERSGGFEPLAKLPDDKVGVLGLVSTKWTRLEDPADLERRIGEASRFHPKEQLALATQCGFASASETAEQRLITEQTQIDKLRLVADVAHRFWQ